MIGKKSVSDKKVDMQVGYNHNIKHKGRNYHVQTEDSGKTTMTITTLLYNAGSIVASKKSNYSKIAAEYADYSEQLKELMQKQHKQMLIDLKNGNFDDPDLADIKEPEEVKEAEDKTIEEAIESTGEKDYEDVAPGPRQKTEEGVSKNAVTFVQEIINSLINTLLSLTQKKVVITKESEELTDLTTISIKSEGKMFIGQTKIYKDVTSECAFACDVKTASVIADLVLLGEGTPAKELSPDAIDALRETFNQAFGSSVSQITSIFTTNVSYDPVDLMTIDAIEEKSKLAALFSEQSIYKFTFNLKIGELITSKIYFYLTSRIKDYLKLAKKPLPAKDEEVHIMSQEDTSVVKAEDKLEEFHETSYDQEEEPEERELRNVELIKGIEVDVKIKLGETIMPLKKISKLAPGTIIELNKDVDSLLELVVNDKPIAEGVLVVVSTNNFAIRITNILSQSERVKKLGGATE